VFLLILTNILVLPETGGYVLQIYGIENAINSSQKMQLRVMMIACNSSVGLEIDTSGKNAWHC
jgi:hypothetical protein